MYKCKECGSEYEEKPDFCDCGNDEFEEIVPENTHKELKQENATVQQTKNLSFNQNAQNNIPTSSNNTLNIKSQSGTARTYSQPLQPPKDIRPKSFEEQYPGLSRFFSATDPISAVIFCFCLLLAAYITFFAWNTPDSKISVPEQSNPVSSKNIPAIDKIWDNTPPRITVKKETKATNNNTDTTKNINNTVTKQTTKPVTANNAVSQKTVAQKPTTKATPPKIQTTINKKQTKSNTSKTQAEQQAKFQAQKAAAEAARKKAEQEAAQKKSAAEKAQKAAEEKAKKEAAEKAKKAAEEKAKKEAAAKQEFSNYKANLRNTIGRKIDFTKVSGNGTCTVAFRIDSNGKLISRSFAKQSSNDSLNDAVYAAVMATPTFNPPPSAYNNEILYLNIRFTNGNYEITLP